MLEVFRKFSNLRNLKIFKIIDGSCTYLHLSAIVQAHGKIIWDIGPGRGALLVVLCVAIAETFHSSRKPKSFVHYAADLTFFAYGQTLLAFGLNVIKIWTKFCQKLSELSTSGIFYTKNLTNAHLSWIQKYFDFYFLF